MTDRPIIFSAPMVRALLDGRKTQTRRVLRPQPYVVHLASEELEDHELRGWECMEQPDGRFAVVKRMPYTPGCRLWVRETVAAGACAPSKPSHWSLSFWRREQGTTKNPSGLWYAADGLTPERTITERGPWKPGIHMPRWASRVTLLVDAVKVERLQDISEEDAVAEGVCYSGGGMYHIEKPDGFSAGGTTAAAAFALLWNSINGPDAWAANPWVVALKFRVARSNIDRLPKGA